MYKQNCVVKIEDIPRNEPIDLYIIKRGASLTAAAVTSTTYQSARIEVESGIRQVADFTRMCDEHDFNLIKDSEKPKQYNLEFILDMCDDLCTIDNVVCRRASLPDKLVRCMEG